MGASNSVEGKYLTKERQGPTRDFRLNLEAWCLLPLLIHIFWQILSALKWFMPVPAFTLWDGPTPWEDWVTSTTCGKLFCFLTDTSQNRKKDKRQSHSTWPSWKICRFIFSFTLPVRACWLETAVSNSVSKQNVVYNSSLTNKNIAIYQWNQALISHSNTS